MAVMPFIFSSLIIEIDGNFENTHIKQRNGFFVSTVHLIVCTVYLQCSRLCVCVLAVFIILLHSQFFSWLTSVKH